VGFEDLFDFCQTHLRRAAAQPDCVDHPAKIACHARGKSGIPGQHCGNRLYGAALIEQQHEVLLAHQVLEVFE